MSIIGARPQFVKAAIVSRALEGVGVSETLVHTGQHYDSRLSDVFFEQLGLRAPTHALGIGSGAHGVQTGRMLEAIERVLEAERPDRVLVYGDTNSTVAGALAAAKLHIPVDHVEAGLRSFDREMPEEINRVVTDHLADQLLCPTHTAMSNLEREGLREGARFTGDVMLDLALESREAALALPLPPDVHEGAYFVATVHRASNTDDVEQLARVLGALARVGSAVAPVVLPVHPRLGARMKEFQLVPGALRCVPPVGYLDMQGLILRARGVITDSGGVQKEALFHGVPCITLRDSTEWAETIDAGLNTLIGDALDQVESVAMRCDGRRTLPRSVLDAFGGGCAGLRIAQTVVEAGGTRRRWRR